MDVVIYQQIQTLPGASWFQQCSPEAVQFHTMSYNHENPEPERHRKGPRAAAQTLHTHTVAAAGALKVRTGQELWQSCVGGTVTSPGTAVMGTTSSCRALLGAEPHEIFTSVLEASSQRAGSGKPI